MWVDGRTSKKIVLILSVALSLSLLLINYVGTDKVCGGRQYWGCMDNLVLFFDITFIALPICVFSLITYKMSEEVSRAWIRFAIWWVPLSMIAIAISPDNDATFLAPTTRALANIFFLASFVIVSTAIIIWKLFRLQKRSKK